jgi:hypothetical protein
MAVMGKAQLGSNPSQIGLTLTEPVEGKTDSQSAQVAADADARERPELASEVVRRGVDGARYLVQPPPDSRPGGNHLSHLLNAAALNCSATARCSKWFGRMNVSGQPSQQ